MVTLEVFCVICDKWLDVNSDGRLEITEAQLDLFKNTSYSLEFDPYNPLSTHHERMRILENRVRSRHIDYIVGTSRTDDGSFRTATCHGSSAVVWSERNLRNFPIARDFYVRHLVREGD